jgi:hypothetical protein
MISMKQSACNKFPFQDDTNLQTFTDDAYIYDPDFDKNSYINCKANSPILGRRRQLHLRKTLIPPPLYILINERKLIFTSTVSKERRCY